MGFIYEGLRGVVYGGRGYEMTRVLDMGLGTLRVV